MVTPWDFIQRLKKFELLLKRFHLNGHTIGFHPESKVRTTY